MSTIEKMSVLASHPRVAAALSHIDATDSQTVADMEELTRIAAPSGMESARGSWLALRLAALGLDVAPPDSVGNIRARRPASGFATRHGEPGVSDLPIMFVSHLDTVFPIDTDLTVRTEGDRIYAPGISDNGRGVAAIIRLASALHAAGIEMSRPLEFVGSVGEEGAGDLRGVKQLFAGAPPCSMFVAVDGAGIDRIVHRAVGSRRLRITITGPGGHSWVDRGTAHPIHALSSATASAALLASYPESSFSVGRIEGGTGINVIPVSALADVDIRSEDSAEIARIEAGLRDAINTSILRADDQRRAGSAGLKFTIESIGDRPGGATDPSTELVQCAWAATSYFGTKPELASSSTDANVAMSLGVPAIAIGAGGDAGGMHTTAEWYSNAEGATGIKRLLLLAVALGEIQAG